METGDQRRRLRVTVSDDRGRPVRPALGRWLENVVPARGDLTLNIALVSDARVRALNRRYRGRDYATSGRCGLR